MESAYGIGIKNRYELFYDDEEDPLDIIKQQEEEKKKKKETKQLQEKENKVKGPGPAPSKTKNIIPAKKGPKESVPVKAQEPSVPRKDDNNRARSQKPQTDRVVKFSGNIREENKDLEERKNRRNREDPRPERSGPPEFRERGGFDRNAQWDGGERGVGGANNDRERNDLKENRNNDGENRRGRGGFGGRGGFRGRGRGRGGAGGPGYDNRGKREFERQSGSDKRYNGIKPVDKREGGGSHNWGTIRDDMDNMNNTAALSSDEAPEWAEKPEEPTEVPTEKEGEQTLAVATEGGEADKPPVEEEPKIMTLDEYKKEQEKKRAVPQFNIRKAGEGEDSTQWKKTYVLKKKEEEEDTEELEEVTDDEEDIRRGRAKHVVDIEINYSDSRRGRGRGRGGRGTGPRGGNGGTGLGREGGGGGGRGSFNRGSDGAGGSSPGSTDNGVGVLGGERGRGGSGGISREGGPRGGRGGGGRGGNKNQSAPKVDDENDFPSLVAA